MESLIFQIEELDIVFTVLKGLGKIINNVGFHLSFERAAIYELATLWQIKEPKVLHFSLETDFVLYLKLYQKYITKTFEKFSDNHHLLKE